MLSDARATIWTSIWRIIRSLLLIRSLERNL
jgi:hypothetical protein